MSQESDQFDPRILSWVKDFIEQAEAQFQKDKPDLSHVEDRLRRALELLEDQGGKQAQGAKDKAGEVWRTLVENTRDMNRSQELLEEGTRFFADMPVGKSLGSMVWRNEQIIMLKDALAVPPGGDWPEWFEKADAHKRLKTLLTIMEKLLQHHSWPTLQKQTVRYNKVLLEEYLPAYIVHLLEDARRQTHQGDFARASQISQKALQFFPDEFAQYIPATVDRQDIVQFNEAINARQRSEAALWTAIVKVVEHSVSVSEAISGIELDLPDHPDVAINDLQDTLRDLEQAAEFERAIDEFSGQDIYQIDFQDLKQRGRMKFQTLDTPATFLIRSDPQTVIKFQTVLRQLREKVIRSPDHALKELLSDLNWEVTTLQDINNLLKYYWQLVWFMEMYKTDDVELLKAAQEAITTARRKPQKILMSAVKLFENVQRDQELNIFLQTLNMVQELNQGLARYPKTASNQSQGTLPPLPDGVELPETETLLDSDALGKWEKIAYTWIIRAHENIPPTVDAPEKEDSVGWEWLGHSLQGYLRDIDELRDEVWPKLDLSPWGQNSLPSILETECNRFLQSAAALIVIEGGLSSRSAVDSIRLWEQRLLDPGLIGLLEDPIIWLLEPQRSDLMHHVQILKGEIESCLEVEIWQILKSHPPSATKLQDQVLSASLPVGFALAARRSIEEQASRLTRKAQTRGDYKAALAVWKAVRQATRPWADHPAELFSRSENPGELWRDLNRRATWRHRRALLLTRRWQIIAGGVILMALLLGLGFGGRSLLSQTGDNSQLAISIANTSTSTVKTSQTPIPTSTQDHQALTMTAVLVVRGTTTQQAFEELVATETARVQHTATARQEALLNQTTTAQILQETEVAQDATATAAADPAFQATAAAERCLSDPSAYSLELIDGPALNPDLGSLYIQGDPVFRATALWTIRNSGECDWESLSVEPYQDALQVNYFFWDESGQVELTSENLLEVGQSINIYLAFPLLDARDIDEAWVLVANGVQIGDSPHLELDVEDWIITISPSPTPTPKPKRKPPTDVPEPTARPTEPPPTDRP